MVRKILCCSFFIYLMVSVCLGQSPGEVKIFKISSELYIEMVWIPAGSFIMGSPENEPERNAAREKQHRVTLTKGFWMARTETTQKVWEAIMGSNPSKIVGMNHPVEQVSWYTAQEFIARINKTNPNFRLPYEAEWEYACRAGSLSSYAGLRDDMTWHRGNADATTHPVATKAPNKWGLYDMHGNVGEMCQDWFQEDISQLIIDPKGPEIGEKKVERGGQYTGRVRHTRSADRSAAPPDSSAFFVGFRVVCEQ